MALRTALVHAALLAVASAASVPPAAAGDGRIEINQTCAEQTGCVPGDAPGFPVRLTLLNRSYVLTSSLRVSSEGTAAIEVLGGGTTLDLNGFAIQGPYSCGTAPPNCAVAGGAAAIQGSGPRITVRNGKIERFSGGGVSLGNFARLEELDIDLVGADGIRAGAGSVVRNNQISNVLDDGIELLLGQSPTDGLVEGNMLRSANGDGIVAAGTLVLSNSVRNTGGAANLGLGSAYGLNRFERTPVGGVSLGNNACGNQRC